MTRYAATRSSRFLTGAASLALGVASVAWAQAPAATPHSDEAAQIEQNLLADLQAQPMGRFAVGDLRYPEPFLRRVRDRTLIALVRRDRLPAAAVSAPSAAPAPSATRASERVRLVRHTPPLDDLRSRNALHPTRPESRGFIADVVPPFPGMSPQIPTTLPPEWQAAADLVNSRLTEAGLLTTLAEVVASLGPTAFEEPLAQQIDQLRAIGLPVDLLRHFAAGDESGAEPILRRIVRDVAAGASSESIAAKFRFNARRAHDFKVSDEGGSDPIDLLRLQVPSATLWGGEPDGDILDAVEGVLATRPSWSVLATVSRPDLRHFLARTAAWPTTERALTVVEEALPVAQWGQDVGKAGRAAGATGSPSHATLVPRYAS